MTISTNKILVPIGFSEQSIIALNQALNLAKTKGAKVVVLSIIEEPSIIETLFLDNKMSELQDKVKDKLQDLIKNIPISKEIDIEVMISKGKVYEQIKDVAEMISADLIVMGTDGAAKGVVRRFIGSNTEKVIRSVTCPVITIKGKQHRDGCQNIVLPLDLEKETKEKVTLAIEYARYWNSTIRIVSVILLDNNEMKKKINSTIKQVEEFINKANVRCTSELLEGTKKQTLGDFVLSYSKDVDGDLLMIMNKKEELVLSNNISVTARYIINNSQIPVMSIRPRARKHITKPTTSF